MPNAPDLVLLLIGALLLFGIIAAKLSPHLGVPALALFVVAGMMAGPEGPGRIVFHDATLARIIGTVALLGILFSSGFSVRWDAAAQVVRPGILLAILGTILATGVVALVVRFAVGLPLATGALLGAVVASTDPVALGSLLRSGRARPDRRTTELMRFESAASAAMGAFLAVALLKWSSGMEHQWWRIVLGFITAAGVGAAVGVVLGAATVWMLNNLRPGAEVLYTLLTVASGFLIYGIAAALHGSGFLAVFVGAVIIGNADLPDRGPIRRFHEGLPWLTQIALFVLLGLLVPPSAMVRAIRPGLLVTGALFLLARPLAALLALAGSRLTGAQKMLVSWVGLKGAVPVALATFPLFGQIREADWILGVVSVVVILSAIVHGITVPWLTGLLRLRDEELKYEPPEPLDMVDLGAGTLARYRIVAESPAAGRTISDIGLPENCLLIMVSRGGEKMRPRGSTVLEPGDEVYAYSPRELFPVVEIRLLGDREG